MSIVLDASAALAWVFERTDEAEAREAEVLLRSLQTREALVPSLWHVEVLNALVIAERRDVISPPRAQDFWERLDRLPIRTDETLAAPLKTSIFTLARKYSLSAYDAMYLDLALRTKSSLATFDGKLKSARDRAGIPAQ